MSPTESDIQFLARMVIASREQQQIPGADARRLNDLATYGDSLPRPNNINDGSPTTLPEERRSGERLPGEVAPGEPYQVVRG